MNSLFSQYNVIMVVNQGGGLELCDCYCFNMSSGISELQMDVHGKLDLTVNTAAKCGTALASE